MSGLSALVLASFLAIGPGETAPEPVANLKPTPTIAAEYETLKSQTGRDAESQIKLALWCEKHGLEAERFKHLAAVVLRDPSHALARGLMGLVEYQGKWKRPEAVAEAMKLDVAKADLLAEYNGKRVKTPVAAIPQYKLALWCEEKGLKDEARAHLATVVRLDPSQAEAWKKLGYKKVGNRWVTEGQAAMDKAERETQTAADRKWKPRLEALRDQFKGKLKREEAEKALAEISDPRAVPMVMKTFIGGDITQQRMAVQLLGQIDAIEASRSLAKVALLAESPEIRAKAIDTLKRRDAREWADLPIGLLRSKIVYTMKPVGGPNDPGVLDIKTKTANYKRIYRPGVPYQPQPGDRLVTDSSGQQFVVRVGEVHNTGWMHAKSIVTGMAAYDAGLSPVTPWDSSSMSSMLLGQAAGMSLSQPARPGPNFNAFVGKFDQTLQHTPFAGQGYQISTAAMENERQNELTYYRNLQAIDEMRVRSELGNYSGKFYEGTYLNLDVARSITVPLAQLQRDALKSQTAAVDQLNGDKAILDQINRQIAEANIRPLTLLTEATGQSLGDDHTAWDKWLTNQIGYALMTPTDVPTVVEEVPINYVPQASGTPGITVVAFRRESCFGKGTLVQTSTGPRPIEDLKIGDMVLSQEMTSGKLRYRPVTVVHRNPPSPTYNIMLNGESVISSYFHRFWKVGQGWVMARDLKTGDTIRVLGGVANVTAIEPASVQPVFNLDIADDADFFAGKMAALVHDNSLPNLKQRPFDAVTDAVATAKK